MTQILRRLILAFALMAGIAPAVAQVPPAVPALPDTERRTTYNISGSLCACAVGFQLYGDSTDYTNWVEVWINGSRITQSGNWTITSPTGSLATIPRPITDAVLTFTSAQTGTVQIVGARRPRRTSQFSENRGVAARDLNQVLSDITAQNRETWDKINDVTGRAVIAPPGETLAVLASAASRASSGACFDASGNLVSCVSIPSTTFTAGNGIAITGTSPKTITNNIQGSGPITITGTNPMVIGCATCNTSPATATSAVFISSRAVGITLNLSTYAVIRTGGYATAGDGGGALFKNVGSTAFQDQNICGWTLTSGSGYTNGTYTFIALTGGTGSSFYATITVSGGAVTNVLKIFNAGGFGYSNGDVLTTSGANIGGTGSGFQITVNCTTTVYGSFTDSAGTHWQYVPENFIDPRQFGVKMDWTGVDGSATDNYSQLQAAFNFSSYSVSALAPGGGGNSAGTKVLMPTGVAMVCTNGLQMWHSTQLQGQGMINSGIHMCDSFALPGANFLTIGDNNAHVACFGNLIRDIDISATITPSANPSTYMLFSNCAQQGILLDNVAVYAGKRGCLDLEVGYGGAAAVYFKGLFCTLTASTASEGIKVNYGTTLLHFTDTIIEASSLTGTGFNALGGVITLDNFHSEGISSPLIVNMTTSNHALTLFNSSGGGGCTNFVTLASTNTAGNFALFNSQKNGCSGNLVQNAQPTGSNRAADARPSAGWVSFNP